MRDGALIYKQAFRNGLRPDPDLTVSQWSDYYRMLSNKASAEPGPWRTDRTPYLREIMDCMSANSPVQKVVFMAGAQLGKTEAINNVVGYMIAHAPGPALFVQPTIEMAKRLSKQRLDSLIHETPCLAEKIAPARSRDSGNTMFSKEYPGGILLLTGANSATGLRSAPCRWVLLDEVDAFPSDVDGEGDPCALAERRASTFSRRKIILTSTPTVKDTSRIETEYLASDQRRYYVPCPHCDHMQWLQWKNLQWRDGDPKTAAYVCESCGSHIPEHFKSEMLRKGEWRATATSQDRRTVGFHLSSLYSPLGWKSWEEIVSEFLRAKNDAPLLKTFVNTVLGETWEEETGAKLGAEGLAERAEFYPSGQLPKGAVILTAGVDVQDNRVAIGLYAWGAGEECWLISHTEIYGDPAGDKLWNQVDDLVLRDYPSAEGGRVRVSAIGVDSGGHFTSEVYAYARSRKGKGIFALKGQSVRNKPPIGKPSKVDINYKGQVLKNSAEVFPVGVDTIKSTLFGRMKHNEVGAGFIHFHAEAGQEYFKQITSERQVVRYVKGFAVREWKKKAGDRNEALDCFVYSYAALHFLYMRFNRNTIFEQFERSIGKGVKKPNTGDVSGEQPIESTYRPPQRRLQRAKSSFVTSW
jgi:phage terminase large subunit GpA-like protein